MNNKEEIDSLIEQLKGLQLQQTLLLNRLDLLRDNEGRPNHSGPAYRARNEQPAGHDNTEEFAVGDRVRINNPRPLQQQVGLITKIGAKLITVTTSNGTEIRRAPQNLSANSA
jgi:hypothetical protein